MENISKGRIEHRRKSSLRPLLCCRVELLKGGFLLSGLRCGCCSLFRHDSLAGCCFWRFQLSHSIELSECESEGPDYNDTIGDKGGAEGGWDAED